MGRKPCCKKEGLNRGSWSAMEDKILNDHIALHGEGKWRNLPLLAGLKRCGKSCRLRWMNYLKPDIKRGNITRDEEDLIIRLHKLLGNRWSLIAGRLPGRTDNEIKNYWNTKIGKRVQCNRPTKQLELRSDDQSHKPPEPTCVVRTKATKCTKVFISKALRNKEMEESSHVVTVENNMGADGMGPQGVPELGPMWALDDSKLSDLKMDVDMDMDMDGQILSNVLEAEFPPFSDIQQEGGGELMASSSLSNEGLFLKEDEFDIDWITSFLQLGFVVETCD